MQSVSPVWTENEVETERVIALDQTNIYEPIIALPIRYTESRLSGMVVRFRLTEAERQAIAEGGDILITELTFGMPFTPLCVQIAKPNEIPE